MKITQKQLRKFKSDGYLTIENVFSETKMDTAINEALQWQEEFLINMSEEEKKWYKDGTTSIQNQLRKLDNPVSQRPFFKKLALDPKIISIVEEIIGKEVIAFFSQIFFKPPHGGGPKPVHQDNFYFGCDDDEKVLTVWLALDDAKIENGCLFYGKGTNHGRIIKHFSPENEPYNYQVPKENLVEMTPSPVKKGGVSIHHGKTFHQSSDNTSDKWRRAMAIHFIQKDAKLVNPIFEFDAKHYVKTY